MILPVFVPHLGCGHRCIYCNQNHITKRIGADDIAEQLTSLFKSRQGRAQVAVYGGNPLGLEPLALGRLFQYFEPYADRIQSFRLSTKPVITNESIIGILKQQNVRTVELGIPGFNDAILAVLQRGHTVADAIDTFTVLRKEGFEVGIQVMVGLPGETFRDIEQTVSHILNLAPAFIRIYPLIVLQETPLLRLFREGRFLPDTIEQAAAKSAFIYVNAWEHGIRTIKMGLTENDVLREKIVAGPYHPAFGYLVKSEAFRLAVEERCMDGNCSGRVLLRLHHGDLPHLIGFRRTNIEKLKQKGITVNWITESTTTSGHFIIENGTGKIKGNLADGLSAFHRYIPGKSR
jgi:histone acetyltransferase (RNA polymerase elongator complex component)